MRRSILFWATFALSLALGAAAASNARAEYPDRPITIIVPWDAGGGTDIVARAFAAGLGELVDVPVNIVNRSGGSGVVGHSAIATAAPDGYTLGVGSPELAFLDTVGLADINPDSFTLISRLAIIPAGVTVKEGSEFDTLQAMIDSIRKEPDGTYTASGSGQGGSWHIALAGMLASVDIDPHRVRWVPSKGGAPALQDVMAGGVTMFTGSPVEAKSLIEAKQVQSLAVMIPERSPAFPDVPTLKEAINSDWTYANWFAFIGPKGLPQAIVDRLVDLGEKALAKPEVRKILEQRGATPVWDGPEKFQTYAHDFAAKAKDALTRLDLAKN